MDWALCLSARQAYPFVSAELDISCGEADKHKAPSPLHILPLSLQDLTAASAYSNSSLRPYAFISFDSC
jgi:hypothetical protein